MEEVQKLRAEKDRAEEVKLAKKNEKEEKLMAFLRCKDKCVCKNRVCLAFNLKRCSACGAIAKNSCGKANCKAAGRTMLEPAARKEKAQESSADDTDDEDDKTDEEESEIDEGDGESSGNLTSIKETDSTSILFSFTVVIECQSIFLGLCNRFKLLSNVGVR